ATSYSKSFSYFMLQNLMRSLLGIDETWPHIEVQTRIKGFLLENLVPNQAMIAHLLEYVLYPHLEIQQLKFIAPERLQLQIFKAITDLMVFCCHQTPLFILIDDLQWCDPLSLQWLVKFQEIAHKRNLAIFFCMTSRRLTEEESGDIPLEWHLHLGLEALEEKHCKALIGHILNCGDFIPGLSGLVEAILSRANGNPYYIVEVLKNLLDDGLLVKSETGWRLTCPLRELPLPSSVQRLIMSRFDRLPEALRHLLQTLSAIGNAAPLNLIETLLKKHSADLEVDLEALIETQLVYRKHGPRGTEFVFYQALTQEVIYNTMVNRRKQLLHQQIGEALETMHMADPSQVLDLLAYHFSRTPEAKKAVRYLNLSALQASRLYANPQALEQYAQILELLEQLDSQALISTDLHNKEWLRVSQLKQAVIQRQCEILLLTGNYDEVLNLVNKSLAEELSPVEQARLLYCKGRVLEKRSEFASARELFEQARALVEAQSEPQEKARLWNAIGWVSRWMGEYDQALAACQSALELLQIQPDMEQIAYAHNVMGVVYFYRHDWERSLGHYRQSLDIQVQIHEHWGQANSLSNIGNVYFMTNRWEEAIQVFQESLAIREQLGDLEGISHSCNNLGHAYQELGRFEAAEKAIRQALGIYRQLENALGVAVAQCNLGTIYFRRQQWTEALELLNPGIESLEQRQMESMLAEAYNHRIETLLAAQQLELVGEYLASNSAAIQTHGDPVQQGRLERLRGKYHLQRGEGEAAQAALAKSLELLQPTDHPLECQALYQELADYHRSQNSDEAEYWEEMCHSRPASPTIPA
ncbi:MAG TPA: tetratricopeptide repeat protein, partial [Candidatus Obscuribacterales bacterium]